jgi:simple sugar transport system substrate-binding protein
MIAPFFKEITMKKLLVVLLVLVVASTAFAAGGSQSGKKTTDTVVGFSQCKTDESDWRKLNTSSMATAFAQPGYRLIIADSNNDAAKQVADVQSFIDQEVDYIVIAAVNMDGWDTVLRNAQRAKIPVILMDRDIKADPSLYTAWLGADFKDEGRQGTEWMAKHFAGKPVNVVHIQGQLGAGAQVGRSAALTEAAAKNGWNILGAQTGNWGTTDAKNVMASWIRQFGDRINAVYAENDNMADGAIQALREAGRRVGGRDGVAIVTFDANRWSLQMTLEGTINANIECNPMLGPQIFNLVQKLQRGETLPKRTIADEAAFFYDKITQEVINARPY